MAKKRAAESEAEDPDTLVRAIFFLHVFLFFLTRRSPNEPASKAGMALKAKTRKNE